MTIATCVKVHDGVVLASDSASTLSNIQPDGSSGVINVYNHADKIYNLVRGLPVGAITAGMGSIGHSSISTLAKDLRRRLMHDNDRDWFVDRKTYTVEEIAAKTRKFFYEERFLPLYGDNTVHNPLFFKIAGFSSDIEQSETWAFNIVGGQCNPPELVQSRDDYGITWDGEPEAIQRLLLGMGSNMGNALIACGIHEKDLPDAIAKMRPHLEVPLHSPPMPVQDAIDLAEFLVRLTTMFTRFKPGAPTVGGPIEVAAITRHEGFKWVKRKHYYPADLNPENPHAAP